MKRVYSSRDFDDFRRRSVRRGLAKTACGFLIALLYVAGGAASTLLIQRFALPAQASVVAVPEQPETIEEPQITQPEPVVEPTPEPLPAIVPVSSTFRNVTAYTSRPEETDSTPCIAASGDDICVLHDAGQTICAANFVPLGTKLIIDNGGVQTTCTVLDRMNSRFQNTIDLYFGMDLQGARNFGSRTLEITILK